MMSRLIFLKSALPSKHTRCKVTGYVRRRCIMFFSNRDNMNVPNNLVNISKQGLMFVVGHLSQSTISAMETYALVIYPTGQQRRTHYAEASRQNKTTCSHEHQEETYHRKKTATSYV